MDTAHAPAAALDPTTRRLILLLPAAFLAHDLGEVAGSDQLNRALGDLAERFPAVADRLVPALAISRRQMAVVVGMLAAGLGRLSWQAARSGAHSQAMTGYAAATLLIGGHILGHVAQAVALRRYLPGLAGGLVVSLPYSVVALGRLQRHGLVDPGAVAGAAAVGVVLGVPALLAVRALGRAVA
jgi:Protein of unknown function with HXXEE motif